MSYYLHRIKHYYSLSKPLLNMGYLTVGWSGILDQTDIVNAVINHKADEVNQLMWNDYGRNRFSLVNFAKFKPGDIVVVPLPYGLFKIVRVESDPQPITKLPVSEFASEWGYSVKLKPEGLYFRNNDDEEQQADIGFFVKVSEITPEIPRSYALAALQSRMKIRSTNANISDLSKEVEEAAKSTSPANIHDIIAEGTADVILDTIVKHVKPEDVEKIVRWYMGRIGATNVYKPSHGDEGADADVVAEFEYLGAVIYIQVKKHDGETGDWAVTQINKYRKQQAEKFIDGVTYIAWVISTAEDFSEEAFAMANENSVRLINGRTFAKMLADVGISNINDILG